MRDPVPEISLEIVRILWFVVLTGRLIHVCYICDISLKYNQQDARFSLSIYFYKLLYMFQAVPPPIIRSTKLYIQLFIFG